MRGYTVLLNANTIAKFAFSPPPATAAPFLVYIPPTNSSMNWPAKSSKACTSLVLSLIFTGAPQGNKRARCRNIQCTGSASSTSKSTLFSIVFHFFASFCRFSHVTDSSKPQHSRIRRRCEQQPWKGLRPERVDVNEPEGKNQVRRKYANLPPPPPCALTDLESLLTLRQSRWMTDLQAIHLYWQIFAIRMYDHDSVAVLDPTMHLLDSGTIYKDIRRRAAANADTSCKRKNRMKKIITRR